MPIRCAGFIRRLALGAAVLGVGFPALADQTLSLRHPDDTRNLGAVAGTLERIAPELSDRQWLDWLGQQTGHYRRRALNSYSGALHGTLQSYVATAAVNQQRYLVGQRLNERRRLPLYAGERVATRGRPLSTAEEDLPGWHNTSVWLSGYREWSRLNADQIVDNFYATGPGLFLGVDSGSQKHFWGAALQYQQANHIVYDDQREADFELAEGQVERPGDTGQVDAHGGWLYGATQFGAVELDASAGYLRHDLSTARQLIVGDYDLISHADYRAEQIHASLGLGRTAQGHVFVVQPHLGLHYSQLERDEINESGAGDLDLWLAAQTVETLEARAGVNISMMRRSRHVSVTPEVNVGYGYPLIEPEVGYEAAFAAAPQERFRPAGVRRGARRADLSMAMIVYVGDQLHARLDYQGRFANREETHGLYASARFLW